MVKRVLELANSGMTEEEIAHTLEVEDRCESLEARDNEYYAHGSNDYSVQAVSQYGSVNDAGERIGFM